MKHKLDKFHDILIEEGIVYIKVQDAVKRKLSSLGNIPCIPSWEEFLFHRQTIYAVNNSICNPTITDLDMFYPSDKTLTNLKDSFYK